PFRLRTCPRSAMNLTGLGFALLALLSLPPLLLETPPVEFPAAPASPAAVWAARVAVLLAMGLAVGLRARADRRDEARPLALHAGLVLLAGLMTLCHWFEVDVACADWQRDLYRDILNLEAEPPHQYRPLPYGFARVLERLTGDWVFACVAYRWFFTYWFVWGYYRFARLFLNPARAWAALLALPVLYPLSIWYYWGQLTDPLSHALFVAALIFVVQDRFLALAAVLALGVMAKETVVLVLPAYWACTWRKGWPAFLKTVALGVVCVLAFLSTRLPLGW